MISRVFVRTVLVGIVTFMIYLIDLAWSAQSFNISQKVFFTIIESAVLLAGLSLLIESFRSFDVITVNRDSSWFVLSGLCTLESWANKEKKDLFSARTCELFMVRSFILAIGSIFVTMIISILCLIIVGAVKFLSNPYVPTIEWGELAKAAGVLAFVFIPGLLLYWGGVVLSKQLVSRSHFVRSAVLVLYACIGVGTLFGTVIFICDRLDGYAGTPSLLMSILMTIGMLLSLAFAFGAVIALGYGLYRVAGKASTRFSILENVWNTICPVRTIVIR